LLQGRFRLACRRALSSTGRNNEKNYSSDGYALSEITVALLLESYYESHPLARPKGIHNRRFVPFLPPSEPHSLFELDLVFRMRHK
jgi:hypothetical protein